MAAPNTGDQAPLFSLPTIDGKGFSLQEELVASPVILAFFKVSCPTCQYAFPFLERLHKALGRRVEVIGVSQDGKTDTAEFVRTLGITFPIALDDDGKYPVSNAYGLRNVPSIFEIVPGGEITTTIVGWSRGEFEELYLRYADLGDGNPPLIGKGEQVADFKAG